jgi:hypothetical protein
VKDRPPKRNDFFLKAEGKSIDSAFHPFLVFANRALRHPSSRFCVKIDSGRQGFLAQKSTEMDFHGHPGNMK